MKKKTDELFTLIKSMTMSEKRYFKIIAMKHVIGGKNNYIRLFEVIEKQKVYDDQAIRITFSDKKFVKQLAVTKTYLYKLILKAMRSYINESSIEAELNGMLADVDFLYSKELHSQSFKVLKKAKKFACKYENYLALLNILEKERRMNMEQGADILKLEAKNAQLAKEKETILAKMYNIDQYQNIHDHLVLYMRKEGVNRIMEDEKKHRIIFNNPLLNDEQLATSFKSKRLFYNSNAHIREATGDFPGCYEYRKKMIEFIESHPEQIKANPGIYIVACINFIIICCEQKKFKQAMQYIYILRKYSLDNAGFKARIFQTGYVHEIYIYLEAGHFEKAIAIIPEVENGLKLYQEKINKSYEILFYSNIACVYIGAGKYNQALLWNNKVLNDTELAMRFDVLSQTRIINLIIHFELGNYDQLEYLVKSTQRFLKKQKYLHKFEAKFLDFMGKRLPSVIENKKNRIKAFLELKEEFIAVSKNPVESRRLEYFDFISWLESKIENRPMAEIVKVKPAYRDV